MNIINSVPALLVISPEEYIPRVFRRMVLSLPYTPPMQCVLGQSSELV